MTKQIETDYLVIGGGAMGFAFADVILSETDATVTIVDRYHQPGGHWNLAYPFVRLHQPSSGYGVESRALGTNQIDKSGWNEGLLELASVGEILAYYDHVLNRDLLPTGRFSYFPMCEYRGEHRFTSLVSGEDYEVEVGRKIVDSTHQHVTVPAMRPPAYKVHPKITCVSPDKIVSCTGSFSSYVIVGAGKTAIDTCLWLLGRGVSPNDITWIMPRDSWLVNRIYTQPAPEFADDYLKHLETQFNSIDQARSVEDLFDRLEAGGNLLRMDANVQPTMYRCATVSEKEITHLRNIKNIVRKGRVYRIDEAKIELEHGAISTSSSTLHIDCTADGLEKRPSTSVFHDEKITLQSVRPCQQVFSAAFIGHIEAAYNDAATKNALCKPVPHPDTDLDWLHITRDFCKAERLWGSDPDLVNWLMGSRLNWVWRMGPALPTDSRELSELFVTRDGLLGAMDQMLEALLSTHRA